MKISQISPSNVMKVKIILRLLRRRSLRKKWKKGIKDANQRGAVCLDVGSCKYGERKRINFFYENLFS